MIDTDTPRSRRRTRLLVAIILTIPCYCAGLVFLTFAPNPEDITPTPTITGTITPILTSVSNTPVIFTPSITLTPSITPTPSITATPTATATNFQPNTVTPSSTFTQTPSQTPSSTATLPPPTITPSHTPTSTATFTLTPSSTPTPTGTLTASPTAFGGP